MYPHDLRAPTNPFRPEYVGFCERCSFKWPYASLRFQYDWRGNAMMNLQILICPRCEDRAQEQFRPVIIYGADSVPPRPRPTPNFYAQQAAGQGLTAPSNIEAHPLTRPPSLQPPPTQQPSARQMVLRDEDFR